MSQKIGQEKKSSFVKRGIEVGMGYPHQPVQQEQLYLFALYGINLAHQTKGLNK